MSPPQTGILFTNALAQERHLTNQILLGGSGVAAGDFDSDGWCDLYFCALDGDNKLYRNRGNWQFEDVTDKAGVACPGIDASGAAFADLNGDGNLDLVVNSLGQGTRIFINSGQGTFRQSVLLNPDRAGTTVALADIDGDGDLDLYIANYRVVTIRDQPNTRFTIGRVEGELTVKSVDGRPLTDAHLTNRFVFRVNLEDGRPSLVYDENGEADGLYLNDGSGRFTLLSNRDVFFDENGRPITDLQLDWGLSAMFHDLNGDGAPDLYVCNDFKSPDRIWLNDGHGHFRAMSTLAVRQTSLSSMGIDIADINRDGHDDIIVLDMLSSEHHRRFTQRIDIQPEVTPVGVIANRVQTPRNTLLLNRGDGTFAEVAQLAGLDATEWSWTPIFLDVDLDGYEDLLISNGFERDGMNVDTLRRLELEKKQANLSRIEQLSLRKLIPRLNTANFAFWNRGNLTFENASESWHFNEAAISQGMALADLDNDGDLDLALNNMNSAASLYRNDGSGPRIAVILKGLKSNRQGIGARLQVTGGPVRQSQEIICGGRYLSSDQPIRTFAAGAATNLTVEVTWRSGRRTVVTAARPNRIYEIREDSSAAVAATAPPAAKPIFQDVSHLIGHVHHQEEPDDFARQPLLPNRLSRPGPGISWFDLDGDGWEDLLIPSGRGGTLAIYGNRQGAFAPLQGPTTNITLRDQTAILSVNSDSQTRLIVGSSSYEERSPAEIGHEYLRGNSWTDRPLPKTQSSTGPLALADYDDDGHLDLFIGGRVVPSAYPAPASSLLLRGGANGFVPDEVNARLLDKIGLVSGAVFSDLDGDGDPDLLLACEWGPIKALRNERGRFQEVTHELGLDAYRGWWTAVTTGDFDGDGRMDIAAANWGRNSKYERFRQYPLRLWYGDLDNDGTVDVLESCFDQQMKKWMPFQPYHLITAALPTIQARYPNAESYATSTFEDIYRPVLDRLSLLEAKWLDSTIFLNRGNRFEPRPLPMEAQFAPTFGLGVADMDNDGKEDLFLSQNFFGPSPETSRYDGGRALWLHGNGDGAFTAMTAAESGVAVYGEGRGAAVCDFDHDGRVDLAVAQNGAGTKLFKNVAAPVGLRIRLSGPPGNPTAIGAGVQLIEGRASGPLREVHAGSGYWSQDGATQIMRKPEGVSKIQVRWSPGKVTTSELPPEAAEIEINATGTVKLLPKHP